jgi:hypothetical protein
VSENGWTDGGLSYDWITKDFDPQTRDKANGEMRVLFMDGHSSHYTADLLEYAEANNIRVLGYPPHCTHALQGLDVVCFAKMKEAWKDEINTFEELNQRAVDKEDFCGVFGRAFLLAFTPDMVKAAFTATGIHPYNADIITAQQMKPSEPTSMHAAFPQPQSSPVRAVLTAFHAHEFTHRGLYPDSPPDAGPSTFPGSLSSPTPAAPHIPIDPALLSASPKRRLDPAADPDMFTLRKRMQMLGIGLASTSSGSFLVSRILMLGSCCVHTR